MVRHLRSPPIPSCSQLFQRDLADINSDGRLTRDGFAVAMHLIQKKLAGVDIPATLPLSLIPPSARTNDASPFSPPTSHHPPEPAKDLLWDDTPPASATPSQPPRSALITHVPNVNRDPFASAHNGKSLLISIQNNSLITNHSQRPIGIYLVMMMTLHVLPLHSTISLPRLATFRINLIRLIAPWIIQRMSEQRLSRPLRLRRPNFLPYRLSSPQQRLRMRQRQNY